MVNDIADAAERLARAREEWRQATSHAAEIARSAYAAGMPETTLAAALGVDRARTLRRWLGKAKGAPTPR